MPISLEIKDGNPHWYLSTDIWTVPNDPLGSPGQPIAGQPCFLYARVANNGNSIAQNVVVKFYWANPSVGFNRNTANFIGQSNISLSPGQSDDVLCLAPWVPSYLNNGHQCILAEAEHPQDPLPVSLEFNVPTDRHVAQRNLSVLQAQKGLFSLKFEIHNTSRIAQKFQLKTTEGRVEDIQDQLEHLDLRDALKGKGGKLEFVGFSKEECLDRESFDKTKLVEGELAVPPMGQIPINLIGRISGENALVHVSQYDTKGAMIGGLSALIINK